MKHSKRLELIDVYKNTDMELSEIADKFGIGISTIYRNLHKMNVALRQPTFNYVKCDDIAERLWAYVNIRSDEECWHYLGSINAGGYGSIVYKDKPYIAHRLSYELTYGEIPEGMLVCHHCDNPPCCNPKHLFLGTQSDNMKDMVSKGRASVQVGVNNTNVKLNEADVYNIHILYSNGYMNMSAISRIFKISVSTVQSILRGRSWPHVKERFDKDIRLKEKRAKELENE